MSHMSHNFCALRTPQNFFCTQHVQFGVSVAKNRARNAMEFPSTAVPMGLGDDGVPVGIQVISLPGNDELTISVAKGLAKDGVAICLAPG